MWQWYHVDTYDIVLLESWKVQSSEALIWSCLVVSTAAFLVEFLKYKSWAAVRRTISCSDRSQRTTKYGGIRVTGSFRNQQFRTSHTIATIYHFFQLLLGFLLMNVFMTFNVYICLSVCLGLSFGYFIFASRI